MMNEPVPLSLTQQLAAAQEWWRDAGVDQAFTDEVTHWLALPQPEIKAAQDKAVPEVAADCPPESVTPRIDRADLPTDLHAFCEWWVSDESSLPRSLGPRIAPRGVAGARLMLVVPSPEADDQNALLQGAQGKLLANILRALSIDADDAYFASALPGYMAEPDWAALHQEGIGAVLAHHIALARPERVILFGGALPLLLGHAADQAPARFTHIDSSTGKVPVCTSFAPDRLLNHAPQRARLWHRLLDWMEPS